VASIKDDDLVELTNTSFHDLDPQILNNLTLAAAKAAEEKMEKQMLPKLAKSEKHYDQKLKSKALKLLQIHRLTTQLHKFYTSKLLERRT